MRLDPLTVLPDNTPVRIGNKRGVVVFHEIVNAVPTGKIVVHTCKLTERRKNTFANNHIWVSISEKTWTGNYSAIIY